jgi:hypothetical protein
MALQLREGLLREAFSVLRAHGAGRQECVVYFTGPRAVPGIVDEVLHPIHHARVDHYEIDTDWLNDTWIALADQDREIRVQVHTHGRSAFHSPTDDGYPIVQTPGFLSLVIPDFAMGPVGLDRAFLVELEDGGSWRELKPRRELVTP